MSHLSRMKNPELPCPSVAATLRAYNYVLSSLDVRTPWEPLLPSQLIAVVVVVVSHILAIPCVLSLV